MHINIMELIKDGKVGDSLKTKGGERYRWNRFAFVKTRKNTVKCYVTNTWQEINGRWQRGPVEKPVCTLKADKVVFNLKKIKQENNTYRAKYRYNNQYMLNYMDGFLSLNLLFNCHTRWSQGATLIHCNNKGDFLPFSKIEFDWNGNLISDIPKIAQNEFNKWDRTRKNKINMQSRARYKQKAAEREFRKYESDGKLDEYPTEKVFTIQNAQLRSYAINAIGLEKVLAPYPVKVIDTETIEGQGKYELVDIQIPSINVYAWGRMSESESKWCLYLKMINQSTGEYHLEGVPRESDNSWNCIPEETVRGALAWRDGESKERLWNGGNKPEISEWKYIEPATLT
tara:strand:- start:700 stop:1725 length:1026 start_codon:yes stop_codon:yes gene_type:complete